jgi:hypothetical protein
MSEKINSNARTRINKGDLVRVFINRLGYSQAEKGLTQLLTKNTVNRITTCESYVFVPNDKEKLSRTLWLSMSHNLESAGVTGDRSNHEITKSLFTILNHPVYFAIKLLNVSKEAKALQNNLKIDSLSYTFRLCEPNFPVLTEEFTGEKLNQFLDERIPKWFNSMARTHIRATESQYTDISFKGGYDSLRWKPDTDIFLLKDKRSSFFTNETVRGESRYKFFVEFEALQPFETDLVELYAFTLENYLGVTDPSVAGTIDKDDIEISIDFYKFSASVNRAEEDIDINKL